MELLTTAFLAGLILLLLLKMKSSQKFNLPPGPWALPVIGNVLQLDKNAPFRSYIKMSKIYGPVLTVYLGWQRTVVLVGHDAVKEALVDQADDFTGRGPLPSLFKTSRGFGLGVSNGERWRQLRRFTLTTLRDFGMGRKGMEEWIQEESKHLRDWIISLKGAVFNPTFLLGCTMSNIVCCLVFGRRFNYDDQEFLQLLNANNDIVKFTGSPIGQMYNLFPRVWERLPGYHHTMFAKMLEIRKFIIKEMQRHVDTLDRSSPRDFIDCFLIRMHDEKDNPNSEFHQDNLVSTVMDLFMAGTETSSSTIRFGLSALIKHPHIQEKVQKEIDSMIGDRTPNMEDKKSLPFTDAVIHEFQRCLDIVPMSLPHYTLHDVSFRGYVIPKDTVIIPLLHSVLNDENHWENPEAFNPEHFLAKDGTFKRNVAFMPFAAGKRACVGESLARMELFIVLVTLMQYFTVSSPGGPDSIDLDPEYSSFANVPRQHELCARLRIK